MCACGHSCVPVCVCACGDASTQIASRDASTRSDVCVVAVAQIYRDKIEADALDDAVRDVAVDELGCDRTPLPPLHTQLLPSQVLLPPDFRAVTGPGQQPPG